MKTIKLPGASPDVELRSLQRAEQRLFAALEEIQALDETIFVATIVAQPIKGADVGAVVVESAGTADSPAATKQDLARIDQAVDRLLDRRELAVLGPCSNDVGRTLKSRHCVFG